MNKETLPVIFLIIFFIIYSGVGILLLYFISKYFKKLNKESVGRLENNKNKEESQQKPFQVVSKYNKISIIGFILSVISIFGIGLAGLVGFILGIIALVQIKHTGEKGKRLAIIAVIVGFIWSFGTSVLRGLIKEGY